MINAKGTLSLIYQWVLYNNSNSASHITISISAMKLTVLRCLSTNLTVLQKLLRLTLRGWLRCETCVFANVQRVNTDPVVDTIEFWNRSRLDRWLRLWFPSRGLKGQRDFVSLVRKSQTTKLDAMDSCANATRGLPFLLSAKDSEHTRAPLHGGKQGGLFTKQVGTLKGAVSAAFKWPHLLLEPKIHFTTASLPQMWEDTSPN